MNANWMCIALAAACGLAAETDRTSIVATVPFAFEAHGIELPAGTYQLERSHSMGVIRLRHAVTGKTVVVRSASVNDNPSHVNSVSFKRYNGVYFLSAVQYAATGVSAPILSSRHQREMAIHYTAETWITRAE